MNNLGNPGSRNEDPGRPEGDRLGPYPLKVGVPALESRRFLWTARAFAIAFFFSIVVNIILASVIVIMLNSLYPLQKVEPWLVTFKDRSDQVVGIEPLRRGVQGYDVMIEALAREYVLFNEEILNDPAIMAYRWNKVLPLRSTQEVFNRFRNQRLQQYEEAMRRGITRRVNIIGSQRRSAQRLTVEFETQALDTNRSPINVTGRTGSDPQFIDRWEASIEFGFARQNVSPADMYINPIGWVVTSYNIRQLN